jgi:hypothetical protein
MLGFPAGASLMAGDLSQVNQLYNNGRIFQLRSALQRPGWNEEEAAFY